MSANRYDREPAYSDRRLSGAQYRGDRNGRMYEDQYYRSRSRDRYQRSRSPHERYSSPPHDRNRSSHSGDEFAIKGASTRRERDIGALRSENRGYEDYRRGRSPSPRGRERAPYRDRDHESYRSPSYESRSRSQNRSRNRSRSRSQRRDPSPYYGGPPSREVILEGLLLDMVEEDVGHPIHHSLSTPI